MIPIWESATDEDTPLTQQLGVDLALDLFGTDVDSTLTTASFAFTSADVTIDGNVSSFADLSELGLSYDGGTGQLQFDPSGVPLFQSLTSTQSAELVVSFTVDDGSLTDTGNLTLLVSGVNDAPVALDPDLGAATDEDTPLTQQLGVDLALDLFGTDVDSALTTASFAFTSADVTIDGNVSSFTDLSELGLSYDGGPASCSLTPAVCRCSSR